ncbi:hypothetical protein FHG87_024313, partial [Trinorchestia longiramus]
EIEENAVEIRSTGGHRSYMCKFVPVVQLLRPVPETVAPLRDQVEEASLPAAQLSPDAVATAELHSGSGEEITPGSLSLCRVTHVQQN